MQLISGTSGRTGRLASSCRAALFAAALFELVGVELHRDVRIGRRVVQLGVDAVEDAKQPVAAVAQDRVEALADTRASGSHGRASR